MKKPCYIPWTKYCARHIKGILDFYCCVTNYHYFNGLTNTHLLAQSPACQAPRHRVTRFYNLVRALEAKIEVSTRFSFFTWWNESTEDSVFRPTLFLREDYTNAMTWLCRCLGKAMDIYYRKGKSALRQSLCAEGLLTEPILIQDTAWWATSFQITNTYSTSPNFNDSLCSGKQMGFGMSKTLVANSMPLLWMTLRKPFNLSKPQVSNPQN